MVPVLCIPKVLLLFQYLVKSSPAQPGMWSHYSWRSRWKERVNHFETFHLLTNLICSLGTDYNCLKIMSIPDAPKTFSMFPPTLVSSSIAFFLQRTDIHLDWLFSTLASTFSPSTPKIHVALIIFNVLHLETVSPVVFSGCSWFKLHQNSNLSACIFTTNI